MDPVQLRAFAARAQQAMEELFACRVEIGDQTVPAARRGSASRRRLAEGGGGFAEDLDEVFRVRASLLRSPPAPGDRIRCGSATYRVHEVRESPADLAYHIGCVEVHTR